MEAADKVKTLIDEHGDEIVSAGANVYQQVTGKTPDADKVNRIRMVLLGRTREAVKEALTKFIAGSAGNVPEAAAALVDGLCSNSETTQNASLQELITCYNLQDPQELGRFLVELYMEQFKHFDTRFHVLEALLEAKDRAKFSNAQLSFDQYEAATDPQKKQGYLDDAQKYYMEGITAFEEALKVHLETVNKIVKRRKFLRSLGLSQMDSSIEAIQRGIQMLNEVVPLEAQLIQMNGGNGESMISHYQTFYKDYILNNIGMLKEYCKTEADAFWAQVEKDGFTPLLIEQ